MFIDIIFQQDLIVWNGFGFILYFYVKIPFLPIEFFESVYTLFYFIIVQYGIQAYPYFLLEVIIIHLFVSLEYDFPYGRFFGHDKGHDFPFRAVLGLHLDILKKTHFIDIPKILIEFIKIEFVPGVRPHHSQDGVFFYALVTPDVDRVDLDHARDLVIDAHCNTFDRIGQKVNIFRNHKDKKRRFGFGHINHL